MSKHGKIVLVGDGGCGKTCLLQVFKDDTFPSVYVPTIVDNFVKTVEYEKGKTLVLTIWDTSGQNGFETMRPLSYRDTDLFLLCYSINHRKELENVETKWLKEVKNYSPSSSYIMVGLKSDLRDADDSEDLAIHSQNHEEDSFEKIDLSDNEKLDKKHKNVDKEKKNSKHNSLVTEEETCQLAEQINVDGRIECSALTRYNVNEVFQLAAKVLIEKKEKREKSENNSLCSKWCFGWC